METGTTFSFVDKTVTIVGGKGKMGNAFASSLADAGANIQIVDRDSEPLGANPKTDMILFALNERTSYNMITLLSKRVRASIPLIITSSTNRLFVGMKRIRHLVPIHALSGPNMQGAVMIDCTDSGTLGRSIATEIARIMDMKQELVPLKEHDTKIALEQSKFHRKVWDFVRNTPDLGAWARQLPISQRRAAIGELRVLLRPDISAELITSFIEKSDHMHAVIHGENENSFRIKKERLTKQLEKLAQTQDPDGLIRTWVRTENQRIDDGVPGGPRSFQAFLSD